MRAMAHPARMAILEYLTEGQNATATECAEVCGLSPSATSYHLRELAKVGLIEEAPSRGDGRERVWRRRSVVISVDPDVVSSPESHRAAMDLLATVLDQDDAQARRWFAKAAEERGGWADSAGIYRLRLMVNAAELDEMVGRVMELMGEYSARTRPQPPADARKVAVLLRVVPTD